MDGCQRKLCKCLDKNTQLVGPFSNMSLLGSITQSATSLLSNATQPLITVPSNNLTQSLMNNLTQALPLPLPGVNGTEDTSVLDNVSQLVTNLNATPSSMTFLLTNLGSSVANATSLVPSHGLPLDQVLTNATSVLPTVAGNAQGLLSNVTQDAVPPLVGDLTGSLAPALSGVTSALPGAGVLDMLSRPFPMVMSSLLLFMFTAVACVAVLVCCMRNSNRYKRVVPVTAVSNQETGRRSYADAI